MRILTGEQWTDGYLDYTCGPEAVRIRPAAWLNVTEIREQYFVRPKSWRLVVNYIREVGLGATLRKIRSRSAEANRNEKFLAVGVGEILETGSEVSGYSVGDRVAFVASNHPRCAERVVINQQMLFAAPDVSLPAAEPLHYLVAGDDAGDLGLLKGWTEHSGNSLPAELPSLFVQAGRLLEQADWASSRQLDSDAEVSTRQAGSRQGRAAGRKNAVLYGYGNYAKTMCLPNVSQYIDVQAIHEIDPTQMPRPLPSELTWDSGFLADPEEDFDVYLVAGYHHTHAPIAAHAMDRGSFAVVEKPIATTFDQLELLKASLEKTEGGLFSGFHKRYARYNDWIFEDLKAQRGDPISVHSLVFEVPLPELHWYRWLNSCGRVVANGCHWLDHFMFMNDFANVTDIDVYVAPDETINASVVLENGALGTMVLTDIGSDRLGVQNNVEFRNANGTVRIINDGDYFAESHDRILRRKNINRLDTYSRMYQTIARRIAEGHRGDSLQSFINSAGLILEVEKRAQEQIARHADNGTSGSLRPVRAAANQG